VKIPKLKSLHDAALELSNATAVFSHTGERTGITHGSVSGGQDLYRVTCAIQRMREELAKIRLAKDS